MEITGKIKQIDQTKEYGSNGFQKRELVLTTEEQYPQHILVQFVQDKCDLLNDFSIDQKVKININLRGREWVSSEGVVKYFNTIQGWRIELLNEEDIKSENKPFSSPAAPIYINDIDWPF